MTAVADRLEFAPPVTNGLGRSLVLAVLAHLLLVGALTLGVQWRRDAPAVEVQAELWSAIPQAAAPRRVEAPPPLPPRPAPVVAPPPPAPVADAEIVLEKKREQERLEKEKQLAQQQQRQREQERLAQQKREQEKIALEKKREQEQRDKDRLAAEKKKQEQEKLAAEKKREQEKLAAEKKKQEQLQAQKAKEEAERIEAQRQVNLARMTGLAGATGGAGSAGTALKASGPSGSYGGRVSAIVKPNIVFTENPQDNPTALVEVRAAPDGTIVARKLVKSSGNKAWDEAVLKAIDKTAVLPRDIDGTVPPVLEINFRRRD